MIFRVKKTKNYTVMSNYHFNDTRLSYKAVGILSRMLSMPDDWEFNLRELASKAKDGVLSVRSGIKELETCGYIKRQQIRSDNGQFGRVVYYVYEMPEEDIVAAPEKTPITEQLAVSENYENDNIIGNTSYKDISSKKYRRLRAEAAKVLISKLENTDINYSGKINKNGSITFTFSKEDIRKVDNLISTTEKATQKEIDFNIVINKIKEQINYKTLLLSTIPEELDEIVYVIADVYTNTSAEYNICGSVVLGDVLKKRFEHLKDDNITIVIEKFRNLPEKITNIKNYLISMLNNSLGTTAYYWQNRVMCDLYGG